MLTPNASGQPANPPSADPHLVRDLWLERRLTGHWPADSAHPNLASLELAESDRPAAEILERYLHLISRQPASEPAADLVDRIFARTINARQNVPQNIPQLKYIDTKPTRSVRPAAWWSKPDVWATAAAVLVLFSVVTPATLQAKAVVEQEQCAFRMAAISRGLVSYQAQFASLPVAPRPPQANCTWTQYRDEPVAPNTRNIFLLVKHGYVNPTDVICGDHARALAVSPDVLATMDNFAKPEQMSYSFHLMYSKRNLDPGKPFEFAILADRNPVFDRSRCAAGYYHANAQNSANHKGTGQNVLYLDGHVQWQVSPLVGVDQDNIWTVANHQRLVGLEQPASEQDSYLVP